MIVIQMYLFLGVILVNFSAMSKEFQKQFHQYKFDDVFFQKVLQETRDLCKDFTIPSEFIQDTPDLIVLILQSRSIDTPEEKQNWFNLLPMMNTEQIEKLRAILIKEKTKLAEIEQ